jgi:flagellin-like hook-associated protein FlgL
MEECVVSVTRIYQNPLAINALRNLKVNGMRISKTLEHLSSGLRINRGADDAAGLSISEKLRSQVRGLQRASANALDGISRIQTAEGALQEVHTILQRIRELSVQAANGVYTADDRLAIQQEVTQLVDEIDRIALTTEFNSKNLLDGTFTALVSTDDYKRTQAIVTGDVGKGGNFVLKATALTTGQLQVQKTDVFTTTLEADAVSQVKYLTTYRGDATITSADATGTGLTGVDQIEVRNVAANAVFDDPSTDGQLIIDRNGGNFLYASGGDPLRQHFQSALVTPGVDKFIFATRDDVNGTLLHSITIPTDPAIPPPVSWNQFLASVAGIFSTAGGAALMGGGAGIGFNNATGQVSIVLNAANNAELLGAEFVDVDGSGSEFHMVYTETGASTYASNAYIRQLDVEFRNNGATTGNLGLLAFANTPTYTVGNIGTTGWINIRFATDHDWSDVINSVRVEDTIKFEATTGTNSLFEHGRTWQSGPVNGSGTFMVSAVSHGEIAVYEFDNQKYTSLVSSGWQEETAIEAARGDVILDQDGNATHELLSIFTGQTGSALQNVHVAFDGILQAGETAVFDVSTTNVLTAGQGNTLASIDQFNATGVFAGSRSTELTVYRRGTGEQATIHINANDTLEDMAGKLSLAIYNPDGTGLIATDAIDMPYQVPDIVHINAVGAARGTISFSGLIPGTELALAGNEALLKALGLVEVQAAEAPVYSVTAYNLETNASMGEIRTQTNEITGLIPGLRIVFDNSAGLKLDADPPLASGNLSIVSDPAFRMPMERPVISLGGDAAQMFVHVAPRGSALQIGANQGATLEVGFMEMTAQALGVEGLVVATPEMATDAISVVDHAISYVSRERTRLGAVQNRIESTIRNLDVAAENLMTSESRIRDADMAKETIAMARDQILMQASTAALAQANQLPNIMLQLLR